MILCGREVYNDKLLRTLILKPDPYTNTHTKVSTNFELMWPTLTSAAASPFLMYSYSKLPLQCTQIYILHASYFAFTSSLRSLLFTSSPPALKILASINAVHYFLKSFLPNSCTLLGITSSESRSKATKFLLLKNWFSIGLDDLGGLFQHKWSFDFIKIFQAK